MVSKSNMFRNKLSINRKKSMVKSVAHHSNRITLLQQLRLQKEKVEEIKRETLLEKKRLRRIRLRRRLRRRRYLRYLRRKRRRLRRLRLQKLREKKMKEKEVVSKIEKEKKLKNKIERKKRHFQRHLQRMKAKIKRARLAKMRAQQKYRISEELRIEAETKANKPCSRIQIRQLSVKKSIPSPKSTIIPIEDLHKTLRRLKSGPKTGTKDKVTPFLPVLDQTFKKNFHQTKTARKRNSRSLSAGANKENVKRKSLPIYQIVDTRPKYDVELTDKMQHEIKEKLNKIGGEKDADAKTKDLKLAEGELRRDSTKSNKFKSIKDNDKKAIELDKKKLDQDKIDAMKSKAKRVDKLKSIKDKKAEDLDESESDQDKIDRVKLKAKKLDKTMVDKDKSDTKKIEDKRLDKLKDKDKTDTKKIEDKRLNKIKSVKDKKPDNLDEIESDQDKTVAKKFEDNRLDRFKSTKERKKAESLIKAKDIEKIKKMIKTEEDLDKTDSDQYKSDAGKTKGKGKSKKDLNNANITSSLDWTRFDAPEHYTRREKPQTKTGRRKSAVDNRRGSVNKKLKKLYNMTMLRQPIEPITDQSQSEIHEQQKDPFEISESSTLSDVSDGDYGKHRRKHKRGKSRSKESSVDTFSKKGSKHSHDKLKDKKGSKAITLLKIPKQRLKHASIDPHLRHIQSGRKVERAKKVDKDTDEYAIESFALPEVQVFGLKNPKRKSEFSDEGFLSRQKLNKSKRPIKPIKSNISFKKTNANDESSSLTYDLESHISSISNISRPKRVRKPTPSFSKLEKSSSETPEPTEAPPDFFALKISLGGSENVVSLYNQGTESTGELFSRLPSQSKGEMLKAFERTGLLKKVPRESLIMVRKECKVLKPKKRKDRHIY